LNAQSIRTEGAVGSTANPKLLAADKQKFALDVRAFQTERGIINQGISTVAVAK
jgi:hypothetical protein